MKDSTSRPRIGFVTFGCRVNQYETQMMRGELAGEYTLTEQGADLFIVNACTVTALAERKARQAIHRLRREHPKAKIVLIGCLAEAVEKELARIDGADLLAGNAWKARIREVASLALSGEKGLLPPTEPLPLTKEVTTGHPGRVRAFLKVQDGCDLACTFCRTTQVRGRSRSKQVATAVEEGRKLVEAGYPELVLTGINLAQYSPPDGNLAQLVRRLLQLERLRRLRLASINPYGITEELVEVFAADPRACPHFHVPLQSGDDRILKLMARGYTSSFYRARIALIRRFIPHATFGADVIVGFPGEDETAFKNTCSLIEEVGFANLHIFRYSPRVGTAAASFPNQVPEPVKRARAERLEEVYRKVQERIFSELVGKKEKVLIEEEKNGAWRGYMRGYIDTFVNGDLKVGEEVTVRITTSLPGHLKGVKEDKRNTR